jgi:adenylate cyclase class 2
MREIEKKYRLPEARRDDVVASLNEIGAVFEGEDFEENTIYAGGALEQEGAIVRIRKTQKRSLLTFKRRIPNDSDVKEQVEYETEISDPDVTAKILAELHLEARLIYEKRRRTWRLRTVEIVLDELPFGLFMEIEGNITGIKEAELLLGIDDLETEHETYPRLTARVGVRNGKTTEARFD